MSETGLDRAERLAEAAHEAFKSGDAERSRELNLESIELARDADDPTAAVRALAGLMRVGLRERDFAEVERLAADSEEAAAGDAALRRLPLHMRAEAARMAGDLADAAEELVRAGLAATEDD